MKDSIVVIYMHRGLIESMYTFVIPSYSKKRDAIIAKAEQLFLELVRVLYPQMTPEEEYDIIENGYYDDNNGSEIRLTWSDKTV